MKGYHSTELKVDCYRYYRAEGIWRQDQGTIPGTITTPVEQM